MPSSDSHATKQAARPGPSAVTVHVPRSESSGASCPVRTPGELGRGAEDADEGQRLRELAQLGGLLGLQVLLVGEGGEHDGGLAERERLAHDQPGRGLGQFAAAVGGALPVRHAAERRLAGEVAAGVGQPQLAAGLGERAGQRRGLAEQEALAELGAERARGRQLLLGVDALGEHQRLAAL